MDNRTCGICGETKPIEGFNFRSRLLGRRHTTCKACQSRFKRAFYQRNLESYKKHSAQQKIEAIKRNRALVRDFLSTHPCVDCGESDPVVLHFDHIAQKEKAISQLVLDGASWERIGHEIAKCQVRCANCHRKKTARQLGWYKHLGL